MPYGYYILKGLAREWLDLANRQRSRIEWEYRTRFCSEVTLATHHGKLTFRTKDIGIAPYLWFNREYEYASSVCCLQFLRQQGFLAPGDVNFYDIGANIGLIGIGLLRAGLVDYVVAFEPDPDNFRLLERNVSQNHLIESVLRVNAALSDATSDLVLELSTKNVGDHRVRKGQPKTAPLLAEDSRKTIVVPGLKLDDFVVSTRNTASGRQPSVVWIDVQGHEGFVFQGGSKVLRDGQIPAVAEIWPYGILRAGMALAEYRAIVAAIWQFYWVERGGRFISYPISMLEKYFEELGDSGGYATVVFTHTEGTRATP